MWIASTTISTKDAFVQCALPTIWSTKGSSFGFAYGCLLACFKSQSQMNATLEQMRTDHQYSSGKRSNPLSIIKCKRSGAKLFSNHSNRVSEKHTAFVCHPSCVISVLFIVHKSLFKKSHPGDYRFISCTRSTTTLFRCALLEGANSKRKYIQWITLNQNLHWKFNWSSQLSNVGSLITVNS